MQFLWKSQLKRGHGKLLPKSVSEKNTVTRKKRLASHEKKSPGSFILITFLWTFFCGTLLYLVLFSSYLTLTTYTVEGAHLVPEEQFRKTVEEQLSQKYFGFISRRRFFLVQTKKLEDSLRAEYPLIETLSVQRFFPDTLTFSLHERETIVLWCSNGICSHILENGSVIPVTDRYADPENQAHTLTLTDESNRSLTIGEGVFEEGFVSQLVFLKRELKNTFDIETEDQILLSSRFANELRFRTKQGFEIYVNTRIAPETTLLALRLILDTEIPKDRLSELQYIDLRTENRVFYLFQEGSRQEEVVPALPSSEVKLDTEKKKKK